jgi:hypothetical protein
MMSKKILALGFCIFLINTLQSQLRPEMLAISQKEKQIKDFEIGKIAINIPLEKSLKDYFHLTDTLDFFDQSIDIIKAEGDHIHFTLSVHRDSVVYKSDNSHLLLIESRIPPYHVWDYDIKNLNNHDLDSISARLRNMPYDYPVLRTAHQTCISYALEGVFRSNGIDPDPFFSGRSNITDFKGIEALLENLFVKVETLENVRKRTLMKSRYLRDEKAFILFRNSRGEPMHACFNLYGRTWTKNGIKPYTSYSTPFPVIDTYHYKKKVKSDFSQPTKDLMKLTSVVRIEIYHLNDQFFEGK